ncbi:unnamed protein product, partial [Tenebrio molitor]
ILCVGLATFCGHLCSKYKETSTICYKILGNLLEMEEEDCDLMKRQIFLIIDRVKYRNVVFSTGGFFRINFTMVFSMFGAI